MTGAFRVTGQVDRASLGAMGVVQRGYSSERR